jgi:hypothetical protein
MKRLIPLLTDAVFFPAISGGAGKRRHVKPPAYPGDPASSQIFVHSLGADPSGRPEVMELVRPGTSVDFLERGESFRSPDGPSPDLSD